MEESETKQDELKTPTEPEKLNLKPHTKYFKRVLGILPGFLSSLDSNRF